MNAMILKCDLRIVFAVRSSISSYHLKRHPNVLVTATKALYWYLVTHAGNKLLLIQAIWYALDFYLRFHVLQPLLIMAAFSALGVGRALHIRPLAPLLP